MEYTAKLVTCSLMTRVVVRKNATEEEIIEAAKARLSEKIQTELGENIEGIEDDEECPFGSIEWQDSPYLENNQTAFDSFIESCDMPQD